MLEDQQWEYHLHARKILQQEKDEARAVQALCSNRSWLLKQLPSTGPLLRPKEVQRVAMQSARSILHGYKLILTSLLVLMGISTFTSRE